MAEFRTIAELARLVHAGVIGIDAAVLRTPYPADAAMEPLTRALAQLRGELDYGSAGSLTTQRPRASPARIPSSAGSSVSSADLGDPAPAEPVGAQVRRDPAPERPPLLDRHRRGVHPEQRDARAG